MANLIDGNSISAEVRAERRLLELRAKGDEETTFESVLANVKERDHIDQTREVSPLRQAEDALLLDNSDLTHEEQNRIVRQWAEERIAMANQ